MILRRKTYGCYKGLGIKVLDKGIFCVWNNDVFPLAIIFR